MIEFEHEKSYRNIELLNIDVKLNKIRKKHN